MKSIIKWVGGKAQLIQDIFNLFPMEMNNYHEPFIGGGSVLLELLCRIRNKKMFVHGKIYAYDSNESLIYMYQNIQKKPSEVLHHIQNIKREFESIEKETEKEEEEKEITEEKEKKKKKIQPKTMEEVHSKEAYYYYMRHLYNTSEKNSTFSSALFIFLNKTCFRGVYRVSSNGFNVPYGNNKHPEIINEDHLREFHQLIIPVEFNILPFHESLLRVKENDFVYLDPPYVPEKETSFVSFTEHGFTKDDHIQLFQLVKCLPCAWLMSNSCTQMVQESFTEYHMDIINVRRSIHSKNPGHKTDEVLIYK